MKDLENILDSIKQNKETIFEKFPLTEIGIFGSFVRGENNNKSDLDIIIGYDKSKTFSLLDLIELEDVLKKITSKKVHLSLKKQLEKRTFGASAIKEAIYI